MPLSLFSGKGLKVQGNREKWKSELNSPWLGWRVCSLIMLPKHLKIMPEVICICTLIFSSLENLVLRKGKDTELGNPEC